VNGIMFFVGPLKFYCYRINIAVSYGLHCRCYTEVQTLYRVSVYFVIALIDIVLY